jgi:hypothetical protein
MISLIQCGDHQSNVAGMSDASIVLRHSIHLNSIRSGVSKYDYKMYALVHKQAEKCSHILKDAGFDIIVRDSPVNLEEMKSKELRKQAPKAWCCGHAEFIKLYAYTMEDHPIVVHMDVDFLITKPMDDLFDAMLLGDTPEGLMARARIPREVYSTLVDVNYWPGDIEAAFTRDWGQVMPGRLPGYQAGFIALKPSRQVFDQILDVIRTADYVEGFDRTNGWGGKGYGGFVGAAAMQGLLAYFYDHVRPGVWIELNQCRFNHMGMDVLYRAQPNFKRNHKQRGQCRNNRGNSYECEDCMVTPLADIYSIHYTQCRKVNSVRSHNYLIFTHTFY